MFKVAHLTNGGITFLKDQSDFARGEFDMGIFPFLRHQLAGGSCAPDEAEDWRTFVDLARIRLRIAIENRAAPVEHAA